MYRTLNDLSIRVAPRPLPFPRRRKVGVWRAVQMHGKWEGEWYARGPEGKVGDVVQAAVDRERLWFKLVRVIGGSRYHWAVEPVNGPARIPAPKLANIETPNWVEDTTSTVGRVYRAAATAKGVDPCK